MTTKVINKFMDEKGRIKQSNGNCIDSAFLTTNYYYQAQIITRRLLANDFVNKDGMFMRYPVNSNRNSESLNWNDPRTVSRDNSIGTYICLASIGEFAKCRAFAWACIKRGNFYQNTHTVRMEKKFVPDFVGISGWSFLLRGLWRQTWFLYPLLLITDFILLLNFVTYLIKNTWIDKDYNSPLLHMVSTAEFCAKKTPTFLSRFSRWLLYMFCPMHEKYPAKDGVGSQLREYSRASYDPPIYLAADKIVSIYKRNWW